MDFPFKHEGLQYLVTAIIQDFMAFMQQSGLSRPQIHALLHIYHAGECPVSAIGELSGASPAAASQLVDRLVQQGLVERSEDPHNRRIKRLRLSPKSLDLINRGVAANHFLTDVMASLTPEQRETVHAAFRTLAQAAQSLHVSHLRKVDTNATHA